MPSTTRIAWAVLVSAAATVALAAPALAAPVTVAPVTVAPVTTAPALAAPVTVAPVTTAPAGSTVGTGPAVNNFVGAFAQGLLNPDAAPVGANDWNCRPTASHPRPVVLVHGTWENAYNNWSGVAPALKAEGYCVFALNYGRSDLLQKGGVGTILPGIGGAKPVEESAGELATFVDGVLAATGVSQVDLVGHSQGGLVIRQYLKFNGGTDSGDSTRNKVRSVVTLGATNHGTSLLGIGALDRAIGHLGLDLDPALDYLVGVSGVQQVYGSPLLTRLNADGDTQPGVHYTVVGSRYDEVTNPYQWTFLTAGPGATVENITLQDGCESDVSDHLSMSYSPRVIGLIKHGLDPVGFPASKVACRSFVPVVGSS